MAKTKAMPYRKMTAKEIKAIKDKLKAAVEAAKIEFNIAENHVIAAEAELECRREFLDDADTALFEAEAELEDFNQYVAEAKEEDDWTSVLSLWG